MAGRVNVVRIGAILWIISSCVAVDWQCSGNGQWALRCSIRSNDLLDSKYIRGEECGEFCEDNPKCIQFSYKSAGGADQKGNCSIFGGRFNEANILTSSTSAESCGLVISRVYPDGRSPACASNHPDHKPPPNGAQSLILGFFADWKMGAVLLSSLGVILINKA